MYDETIEANERSMTAATLFKPSNWLTRIEFINHLALLNNLLIAVFAGPSGGKTSFIRLLCQGLDTQLTAHVFNAGTPFDSSELLLQLAEIAHIGFDPELGVGEIIKAINQQKNHRLIIIDDAGHLPIDFLQAILTEMSSEQTHHYFHVCLVSDFSLVENLAYLEAEHFPNFIHTIELGPLTKTETTTYVLKNLACLPRPLNKKVLDQIYQDTGGNLAQINNKIHDITPKKFSLRAKARKKENRLPKPGSIWLGGLIGLLVISLTSTYLLQNKDDYRVGHSKPKIVWKSKASMLINDVPYVTLASVKQALQSLVPPENDIRVEASLAGETVSNVAYQPQAMYRQHRQQILMPSSIASIGPLLPNTLVVEKPKSRPVQPHPQQITKKSAAVSVANKVSPARFTIQLLASQKRKDIQQFIAAHAIKGAMKIRVSKRQGVNWYVLTLGDYQERHEAQAAIRALPKKLVLLNPWIRPVAGLSSTG